MEQISSLGAHGATKEIERGDSQDLLSEWAPDWG